MTNYYSRLTFKVKDNGMGVDGMKVLRLITEIKSSSFE